jgi:glycosyltransferase involved in cell wall biosynthesis
MKPLHVVQFGSGNALYGAERWILALLRNLDPARVRSTVVTLKDGPDCPTALVDEASRQGFPARPIDAPGRLSGAGVRAFGDLCRSGDVDIVHAHGYKPDVYGLLARRRGGYKLLITPHGWNHQTDLKEGAYEFVDRLSFVFADAVAPLSEGLARSLWWLPLGRRLRLISNGVDTAEVDGVEGGELPMEHGPEDFIIGYVGRLEHVKGVDVLVEGLGRLGPGRWRCLIVGDGPDRAALEARVRTLGLEGRVVFAGFRQDRIALLKRLDLFVLPSRSEGTPRSLMEAMVAGVPALGADIPGIRVLIEPGRTGWVFPSGDPEALAAALRERMERSDGARPVAEAGRRLVHERFSAARMARDYERLFAELVGTPG